MLAYKDNPSDLQEVLRAEPIDEVHLTVSVSERKPREAEGTQGSWAQDHMWTVHIMLCLS